MKDFEILQIPDTSKWNKCLLKIPKNERDIYFTPEYFHLHEKIGDGKAQCFVFYDNDKIAIYPFMLGSINSLGFDLEMEYFDIQGVYGYNGIITNTDSQRFIRSAFNCFDDYCRKNNIIAEFLRINPLLKNPFVHRPNFNINYDRDNVFINLLNDNIFETEFEYSTRKNVRKAIKSGLTFKSVIGNEISNNDLEAFCHIYYSTMDRNKADSYYYFDKSYFNYISHYLGEKSLFVFVLFENQIISCELVLLGNKIAYSFLGGTLIDYYSYRPNDFLKHETINILKKKGFEFFLLGGGSEGIFRYKKSFAKNGVIPFYIGKKIHNLEIYRKVVNKWIERNPDKFELHKNRFLIYRF